MGPSPLPHQTPNYGTTQEPQYEANGNGVMEDVNNNNQEEHVSTPQDEGYADL